jgi:hypothetical protein
MFRFERNKNEFVEREEILLEQIDDLDISYNESYHKPSILKFKNKIFYFKRIYTDISKSELRLFVYDFED